MVSIYIQSPNFLNSPFPSPASRRLRRGASSPQSLRVTASRSSSFDVVVVGGGIIGLTIARQFLTGSDLSVAVVDKAVPCSGATGAGQGYIWMTHKKPGSDIWDLAMRSHQLWHELADSLSDQGLDPQELLGWKKTGSLLVGKTSQECVALKQKVNELTEGGLRAEYLSSGDLFLKEPAILVDDETGAAFLPDDSQLDAHRAVAYIEKGNREFATEGRYAEFYHEPVTGLIRSDGSSKEVTGVQTLKRNLYGKKATIVAAGCWSGSLMHDLLKDCNISVDVPVKPRKGHLLVVENFDSFHLNHGMMEAGYADHQSASAPGAEERMLSISMTATMDTTGNLVLGNVFIPPLKLLNKSGSSREFVGFDTEADETIIRCIWERAAEFFPKLRDISIEDFIRNRKVRVGLRPYMPDGKPVIGSVPGLQNLYLAAGHEGGGLSMALGTAEMVSDIVLGKPSKVDVSAFQVKGRCPLPPILPHEVHFGKGTIDLGGLEVKQVSISKTTAKRVWRTYEGGRDNMGFSIFEPTNLPANFFKLGFYAQPNNQKLFGWILVARDVSGSNLRPPVDYIEVWNTASLGIRQDGHAYFWQPVCLKGYKPVGVFVTTSSQKPPMKQDSISCVRSELTEQSEADTLVWGFKGINVVNSRPVQRGTQATGVYTGTFSFQQLNSSPLPYLFCLKNTKLNMSSNMPSKAQTRALFKTYSPLIYFHPKEIFLPSSVHWFFANGALLYKKGNESNPIPIQPNGTNLPQGGSNDDLFWLDYPLDKTAMEKVKRGDLRNTKVYLNIKPMFGGTFTDIAVWIFCPFNGNAHLKFLFIKSLSLGQIGEHVGDWEHVTLRISNFNGKLWRVYFSQHSGGTLVDACDLEYVEGGNKPVIYSSLHGHAMFSKPGLVLQGKRRYGIRNDMARSDKWLNCGKGYEVIGGPWGVVEPAWTSYFRKWGPRVGYKIDKPIKSFAKKILPMFVRKRLRNIIRKIPYEMLGEDGPTGPKAKLTWTGDDKYS
uniref:FAD dependent oxidoreductase domain-containing protein n=1 Tax=Brassica oleracea TaxID=3712 RepID=A0A3P6EMS9_BRAOL|nr:unnamed protein product [Brassica oleracea]